MSFLENITAQLPFGKKSDPAEYFFVLNIGLSEITAAVWAIYGHEIEVLSQSTLAYEGTDDLLEKAYQALDKSLGALEIEPHKVLFGVPETWSLDDDLKEPYLKLLRKMLKEFGLEPLAYVTTTNALSFFLQKQEGVGQTAILLGIGDFLEVTLTKGGKTLETRVIKRSTSLFEDIEKILSQFTEVEVLPSKILLYPTKKEEDLAKIRGDLMSFPWMQRLSFLHFPKIDLLNADIALWSVLLSAASEMNPHINLKHHFSLPADPPPSSSSPHLKEMTISSETSSQEEDLGFVSGDIKQHLGKVKRGGEEFSTSLEKEEVEDQKERFTSLDEENLEDDNLVSPDLPESAYESGPEEEELLTDTKAGSGYSRPLGGRLHSSDTTPQSLDAPSNFSLPAVVEKAGSLMSVLVPAKGALGPIGNLLTTKLLIIPVVLLLLAGAYLFLSKAEVNIFVEPKVLENSAEIVADPKVTEIDEEKKVIPGIVIETTLNGTDKSQATGKKQIGDPAHGKAVIYNLTAAKVSLSQGTILISSEGLKFALDSSVQIASQSSSVGADFTTVIKPGKSDTVGVTAKVIGPEGNLPGGTDLLVTGYQKTQVVARVEEALSGGTSKEVTVVTADDQKKLQAKVLDGLRQKAQEELKEKQSGDQKVIAEALSVVEGKYKFNKQIGDQANEFSLNATVHFKGIAYSDSDLKNVVSKLVQINVPEGFGLSPDDMETQADISKVDKNGGLIFKAKFKAKLMPKYNLEEFKANIKGKSVEEVAARIKELENAIGSEIKLSPSFPAPLARLPYLENNIAISVSPK